MTGTIGTLSVVSFRKIWPISSHCRCFGWGKRGILEGDVDSSSRFFGTKTVTLDHSDVGVRL